MTGPEQKDRRNSEAPGDREVTPDEVIEFWFSEEIKPYWWKKDPQFDAQLQRRFGALHRQAASHGLPHWRISPTGRLAEILVLDQFSRNLYRDDARAFAQDEQAVARTREALAAGADTELSPQQRAFLYLPLMHSEDPADHDDAVRLYASDPALAGNYEFELKHKAIIDRFGRYPHRNEALGRTSTDEERAFLDQPGSSF
ncbi:DUF924 family protein [Elongatibacter sediminis]|uniref:DUF924 family protein n=1 Tax=Elongatibacter sediminis TaxID=3119006 RepID=A0AAW9RBC1_9GAMM